MTRHLVICTDGTWNQPDQKDRDRMVPTNVAEVARALSGSAKFKSSEQQIPQLVYYDTGIGTGVGWFRKYLDGATGLGLKGKILGAYQAIADVYQPGDKIFLFGFSRGAYTARSLAGLIGLCGIPDTSTSNAANSSTLVERAYHVYRNRNPNERNIDAEKYAEQNSRKDNGQVIRDIHFIGVWDTVGALGVPYWPLRWIMRRSYKFHDITLGAHVRHAFHAMAIDERRRLYAPAPWEQGNESTCQTVEQLWFPGVHANIGGGYADSGLADRAFLWMCLKAAEAGLGFKSEYMNLRVDPNYHGELRNSCRHIFKLTARPRTIGSRLKTKNRGYAMEEKIHFSARERFEHATELEYRKKHIRGSLGRVLRCMTPSVADALDGEIDCHQTLQRDMLNDGGGAPQAIGV